MSPRRVVAIGGGHGLARSLRAALSYADEVTALVATSDDGGSSGRLRADLGMPAPGDLRRALTTLAADHRAASRFEHRFTAGELAGHSVGNLLLAGLVDAGETLAGAARIVADWLEIDERHRVLPITCDPVQLVGYTAAERIVGQVRLKATAGIERVAVEPADPRPAPGVVEAIAAADQVLVGPGSLFTSVLAAVTVPAVGRAIEASDATVVFVANLRSDEVEAKEYTVRDQVDALRRHGVDPDITVVQEGAIPSGDLGGVPHVVADVDRPHGLAHDAELLGSLLRGLG